MISLWEVTSRIILLRLKAGNEGVLIVKNLLNIKNENLLEIVGQTVEEIITEAVATHGISRNEFRAYTGGEVSKIKAIVYYQKQIVFRVGVTAGEGLEYFLEMAKDQARDFFSSYFALEDEVA